MACEKAVEGLESHGISTEGKDSVLMEVAKTSLTGKSAGAVKSFLADICVRAVNAVGQVENDERMVDLDDIKVEKRQGGSIKDSTLVDGIILDKERVHAGIPCSISDASIALSTVLLKSRKLRLMQKSKLQTQTN